MPNLQRGHSGLQSDERGEDGSLCPTLWQVQRSCWGEIAFDHPSRMCLLVFIFHCALYYFLIASNFGSCNSIHHAPPLCNPMQYIQCSQCQHRFCKLCIERAVKERGKGCPQCRMPVASRRALRWVSC